MTPSPFLPDGSPAVLPDGSPSPNTRPPMLLPPSLAPGIPREPIAETFARARWLLGGYWLLTGSGFVVFLATAFAYWRGGEGGFLGILALTLVCALGVALGNLLAMLRVRTWLVQVVSWGLIFLTCFMAIGAPIVALYTVVGLFSVGFGHLTLQRRFSLSTLWVPIIFWIAAILTIIENAGRLAPWLAGQKDAVWQPITLVLLTLFVTQFFFFLAGQEHYHTQVWQAAATTTPVRLTRHRDAGATRLTRRGIAAVMVFSVLVTAAVAMISPYLWRTERREGNGRREHHSERDRSRERDAEPRPGDGDGRPRRRSADWDGLEQKLERAAREAKRQSQDLLPFVPLFLLNRPVRRLVLLRHLRKPFFGLTPTQRANNLWRYVLIALGDVKDPPRTGESLDELASRITSVRTQNGQALPEGLAETCEIYQRIRFGLGIPAGSLEALRAYAERAFVAVRAPMDPWERVRSWWRKIEV